MSVALVASVIGGGRSRQLADNYGSKTVPIQLPSASGPFGSCSFFLALSVVRFNLWELPARASDGQLNGSRQDTLADPSPDCRAMDAVSHRKVGVSKIKCH